MRFLITTTGLLMYLAAALQWTEAIARQTEESGNKRYVDKSEIVSDTRPRIDLRFPAEDNREYGIKHPGEAEYPARLRFDNVQGWVVVEFDITPSGVTENITVVDAYPDDVFDKYAIEATRSSQYYPKIVDGSPVRVTGVRNIIKFCLETDEARGQKRASFCLDDEDPEK